MSDLPNLANPDYVERVNRAIDHITRHLDEPLPLDEVARIAGFSPYHFHRIFRALVGEPLGAFTKRLRLDRAVYLLSHRPDSSMTEIALACGFSSSSDFSRSFRAAFGTTPSGFDVAAFRASRRDQLEAALEPGRRQHRLQHLPNVDDPDAFAVRLVDLGPRRVAYLRVGRPYEPERVTLATGRLVEWARQRGLAGGQWLGYQWEDPEIVPLERCRYDVAVEVPESVVIDGGVSEARFDAMRVAQVDVAGPIDLELRALDWLFGTWLPRSGYVPDHQPAFEAWMGEPSTGDTDHLRLRIQLPVTSADRPSY